VLIAIFSDVHGNLTALEAVLADINKQSPDITAFAGDLCLFGPHADACLDRVRHQDIVCVYGNTDEWIIEPPIPPDDIDEKVRRHRQHLFDISSWTQAQLIDPDRDWLRSLPFEQRVSPTGDPHDDLLIVHANPQDVSQLIFPTNSKQMEIFGQVKHEQRDDELASLVEDVKASVMAFGHLHVPNIRQWGELILANISSVSLAGDGDPRAKYGLLTWDINQGWSVEQRHVVYDMQKEIDALATLKPPAWRTYARRLESAGVG
jgi:predicted phosphodiesterase